MRKMLEDWPFESRELDKENLLTVFIMEISYCPHMADIAAFYASQKPAPGTATDETRLALGKAIYRGGNMTTGVPACMGCHGPSGAGNPSAKYPALAGQHADYTVAQLKTFHDGSRNNDPNKMMVNVAVRMTGAEMEAVANYIATLK